MLNQTLDKDWQSSRNIVLCINLTYTDNERLIYCVD